MGKTFKDNCVRNTTIKKKSTNKHRAKLKPYSRHEYRQFEQQ